MSEVPLKTQETDFGVRSAEPRIAIDFESDSQAENMDGKKFRFSLQKVLELRRHQTKLARHRLAEARRDLELKETQLRQAREYLGKCQQTASDAKDLRPAELRQDEAYRRDARKALKEASEAVDECRERVERAREDLRECQKEEEALEKLRDEKKEDHDEEQAKATAEFFDEQAAIRHARSDGISLM